MKNEHRIDRRKRSVVETICDAVKNSEIVNRAIIFGSTVTDQCTDSSDLDICMDINCGTKDMRLYELRVMINRLCDYDCDIVIYSHIGERLKKEIDSKGVVVYES